MLPWQPMTSNQFCHLQMPLENFQPSKISGKIFKVINGRGHVWFSTCGQKSNSCQECSKIVKIATKSCQKMTDSKFKIQWRIAKLISKQKCTQCTQQKLKLISGWSHSRSINAMSQRISQVIIKLSTQNTKKRNNQIDLLPIINDNKLLYKN